MKARSRCLCPKPDHIRIAHSESITEFIGLSDDILFWRNATTKCSRCGVPLCCVCGDVYIWWDEITNKWREQRLCDSCFKLFVHPIQKYGHPCHCPTCAEEMR